ncbi:hypothetical protein E2C01_054298 [Portunus trituberculatus]|uniref:Uncharacterized protein n=1 Tax=Portunus trituberculatus TaxID=210409 RepID=A0A5B7GRM1_PORTR|nr:hypothetical protein [Portunus trituberculatus]
MLDEIIRFWLRVLPLRKIFASLHGNETRREECCSEYVRSLRTCCVFYMDSPASFSPTNPRKAGEGKYCGPHGMRRLIVIAALESDGM